MELMFQNDTGLEFMVSQQNKKINGTKENENGKRMIWYNRKECVVD